METCILYNDHLKEYDFGEGHPFRGDRFINFHKFIHHNLPEGKYYDLLSAKPASDKDLQLICHKNYIEFTRGYYEAANLGIPYPGKFNDFQGMDNIPTGKPGKIEEAARLIIGEAKLAVQLLMKDTYKKAIVIGGGLHHAKPNYGEGFCLYNDVAFTAKYLMEQYGLTRVLVLDTDAHCGNGTMQYLYEEERSLFIDIHQDPVGIYPGTGFVQQIGTGKGKGHIVNIPMPEGSSDSAYRIAFETIIEPLVKEFEPQIIIRNGGSDPHFADGLTQLGLTMDGFYMIGNKVRKMSEVCNGKVLDMIASGYNPQILPYAWTALIEGLLGVEFNIKEPVPAPSSFDPNAMVTATLSVLAEVKECLSPYWKSLK
jgi:acetoin utilization protein AcuC